MFLKKTMSIRQLMIGLVVLIAALMMGLMVLVSDMSHGITRNLKTLAGIEQTALIVKDIRYHTVQVQQFLTDASLTHELDGITDSRQHADAAQLGFQRLEEIEPAEKVRLQKIAGDLDEMRRVGEAMVDAYLKQGVEAGNLLMKQKTTGFDDRSLQVQGEVDQLVQDLEETAKRRGNDVQSGGAALVAHAARLQLAAFVTILICSLLALALIGRRVKNLSQSMEEAFSHLSSGDLSFRLEATTTDEIGKIGRLFNFSVEQFGLTLQKFLAVNDQISSATAENYINAHDIASEVFKQAQQIDSMAANTTQISATIAQLASSTEGASKAAQEVAGLVQRGSRAIAISVDSMQQVKLRSDESVEVINQLGKRSTEIGKIADVINDIAAQTNLLALNAAIEAARAGEQGRGFSVVADEVRQLAVKTAQATNKITEMIKSVQSEAQRSVVSMQSVSSVVTDGVALIRDAGDALQQIIVHSNSVASRMSDLAEATAEQSTTVAHLAKNIDVVAKAGRNIAERAEKDAAAADTLAVTVADELGGVIQYYRFGEDDAQRYLEDHELDAVLQSVPPLFVWDDDLSVGIGRVDEQHKVLIAIINRLNAAMKKRMSAPVIGKVITELLNYTKEHFSMEEELFKRYAYHEPEYSQHLRAHAEFIDTLADIKKKHERGDDTVSLSILSLLRRWLIEHIKGTDKKYVPFLLQRGVR